MHHELFGTVVFYAIHGEVTWMPLTEWGVVPEEKCITFCISLVRADCAICCRGHLHKYLGTFSFVDLSFTSSSDMGVCVVKAMNNNTEWRQEPAGTLHHGWAISRRHRAAHVESQIVPLFPQSLTIRVVGSVLNDARRRYEKYIVLGQ